MITTEQIKKLRDETGVSVMQCKKALEESGGDTAKAKLILGETSRKSAEKKMDRELGAGIVVSYVHNTGTIGAMIELLCETDFVARNEEFRSIAKDIAMHIVAMNPETKEELVSQEFIKDPSITIKSILDQAVQKFGERTDVGQFVRFSIK